MLSVVAEILSRLERHRFAVMLIAVVLFAAALAHLSATILNSSLERRSSKLLSATPPAASRPARESAAGRSQPLDHYRSLIAGHLIPGTLADSAVDVENVASDLPPAGEFTLLGVLAGAPSFARASIQISGAGDQAEEYAIGSTVAGFRLVSILSRSVVIEYGSVRQTVWVGEKSQQPEPTRPAATASSAAATASGSNEQITVSRERVMHLTRDQSALYENRFTPVTEGGRIVGLKLIFVPQDNVLHSLGARSGDIIRRIDGQPLEDNERLIQLFSQLRTTSKMSVDLERGGRILNIEVIIED